MDENKRIMHDSKGQPILSDCLLEKKEGRFSQNVAAAIDGVLPEEARINHAWYIITEATLILILYKKI
jgi:hypothetical protein